MTKNLLEKLREVFFILLPSQQVIRIHKSEWKIVAVRCPRRLVLLVKIFIDIRGSIQIVNYYSLLYTNDPYGTQLKFLMYDTMIV